MKEMIRSLLEHIGENPDREGLKDTPDRVERAYEKIFSGYKMNLQDFITTFDSEG